HGDRQHIFLWQEGGREETIAYAALDLNARRVAGGLVARGLNPGERVAIMLPTEAGFFYAFYGVLMAGGVPVPIYPPYRRSHIEEHLRRQAGILRSCEASLLVTNAEVSRVGQLLFGLAEKLRAMETVADLLKAEPIPQALPAAPEAIALIQYTSGSTGDPKGVVLSHANLLANIRSMGTALGASSADVFASWLPLYHDMGLIGAWLACLYYAAPTSIMPPLSFLTDPGRWLRTIHRHRATLSAAPNFAFELCTKSIQDRDLEGIDLSCLRFVVNGAEPVSVQTLRRFIDRFGRVGFSREAMAPSYGLAENAVGLAFPPVGRGPAIDRIDRETLSRRGVAKPAESDAAGASEIVGCGRPIPNHEVRIIDDVGRELPDRHEGRLQFRGPSSTKGYYRNPERTRALFDGDWLESGDRAYIADGEIYITGRIKDIIIRGGRNIYPQEIEELVGTVPQVRKGCVAAFASRDERSATERLVVMAETRLTDAEELQTLRRAIIDAIASQHDMTPDEVVLTPPWTVPKTSSGKIRRSAARELYESGAIGAKGRALWLQVARLAVSGFALRTRRWAGLFASALYAAWWWSVLALTAVVVWPLAVLLPRRPWRHAAVHAGARAFLGATGLKLKIHGDPATGPAVFVCNHASYFDSIVLFSALPGLVTFVAKEELGRQSVAGPFLRGIGAIFARRTDPTGGVEDTEKMLAAVRGGSTVVVFPEGTLTRMPGLLGFHLGAFLVAAKAGLPIVPLTLRGTRFILRDGQWWPRRGPIELHIGQPIMPDGAAFEAAVRLRDAARAEILSRSGEPDLATTRVAIGP
ncbi:MAG: AMP-binding protein, partial [Hyphomicrobiaceae bacterium]